MEIDTEETTTDLEDSVQRTDATSAGDHVGSAADGDSAAATDGTSQGTASTADGTAAESVNPDEATANDSSLAVAGPGDSPNE